MVFGVVVASIAVVPASAAASAGAGDRDSSHFDSLQVGDSLLVMSRTVYTAAPSLVAP